MSGYVSQRALKRKARDAVEEDVVVDIASLKNMTSKWRLKARLVFKNTSTPRLKTKTVFIFMDDSGFINVNAWQDVGLVIPELQVGESYEMTGTGCRASEVSSFLYSWVRHKYYIDFGSNRVQITAAAGALDMSHFFTYVAFDRMSAELVIEDVVGFIYEIGEVRTVISKFNPKKHELLDVILSDAADSLVCVTLWNERAIRFMESREGSHVVHFKGVKCIPITQDTPVSVKHHFKAFVDTIITPPMKETETLEALDGTDVPDDPVLEVLSKESESNSIERND